MFPAAARFLGRSAAWCCAPFGRRVGYTDYGAARGADDAVLNDQTAGVSTGQANGAAGHQGKNGSAMSVSSDAQSAAPHHAAHVTLDPDAKHDPHETRLGDSLKAATKLEAADLIMKSGQKPKIRLRGALKPLDTTPVSPEEFLSIAKHILDEEQFKDLRHFGSVDFAYDYDESNRFRVNLFQARGKLAVAARLITSKIRRFDELYLPPIMSEIAMQPQGIVLLCGVTGSGKSTTIAAMLDYVNERKPVHIVTIEDPIEYIFNDKKATVNQREIGIDSRFQDRAAAGPRESGHRARRRNARQGDFEAALHAAETGHLVYGTIHASSTTQTFSRIYACSSRRKSSRCGASSATRCEPSSTRNSCPPSAPRFTASPRSRSSSTTRSCASTFSKAARANSASTSIPSRPSRPA